MNFLDFEKFINNLTIDKTLMNLLHFKTILIDLTIHLVTLNCEKYKISWLVSHISFFYYFYFFIDILSAVYTLPI